MSFSKNLTISVRNTAAQLSEPLYVYEKDRNLIMYFKIMDHKYKFDKNPTNVLASMDDVMSAYVIIVDPNGYELTHQNGEVIDDEIKFVITDELIDEITEIGTYQLQFHIKCECSEFTIPPISFEVLERLKGIKSIIDESEVGDVITNDSESFIDEEGKLQIVWKKGDTISSVKLNQMVEVVNNAVDEEHSRKLNERERVDKENERVTKENKRIANEDTRTASENTRIENENTRVTSESTRLSNEAARIANEDERKAKETLRQSEENKRQTNEQTRIQNEENRVTAENARVASMNDITTRFNDLIASLPQYPEVIDARDGEVSLKARLDRDIEKAKQVYVNVEGSHISTDSSSGYAKDVEILGNTIQDASNLADIRSVGDKVEGQELYEIPVLSRGKNLFDKNTCVDGYILSGSKGEADINASWFYTDFIKVKAGVTYRMGLYKQPFDPYYSCLYSKDKTFIKANIGEVFTPSENGYVRLSGIIENKDKGQLEESAIITPYEPYIEDKLTILSPTPLEKVGDVADRIIEKDGVFGVEKNVETVVLNGSEDWKHFSDSWGTLFDAYILTNKKEGTTNLMTSTIPVFNFNSDETSFCCKSSENTIDKTRIFIKNPPNIQMGDVTGFKTWLSENNVLVKYPLTTPTFIPLPHDQQVKLRTFASKTNITFGCEIEGTIKAQVPKSLGATVNTHTEQISNLNKELDRVKKLEESTVSTVETESDFTTVEATSNGYFEDVKLEGKTLTTVLTCSTNRHYAKWTPVDYVSYKAVEVGKVYTIIAQTNNTAQCGLKNRKSADYLLALAAAKEFICKTITFSKAEELVIVTDTEGTVNMELMILEGDHTQNPPSYFEGLKSVGDGVDEVSVESVNENIFSGNILIGRYDETGNFVNDDRMYTTSKFKIQANKTIMVNHDNIKTIWMNFWDVNMNHISQVQVNPYNNITTPINCVMCSITSSIGATLTNLQVEYGTISTPYVPHQSDKKRLLYYNNETQTWEKPILREWDTIEKHANGKYYYHQRSGEVVLNGSENWTITGGTDRDTVLFFTLFNAKPCLTNTVNKCISDKINSSDISLDYKNIEGIYTAFDGNICVSILKSKLSTQDVQGFKQWLQANNVTVVYQLAEEKVYECTNTDLITYANETNYIVNSGAIPPRTTLKVHNNISNVVSLLQKKVSVLESNITAMFRAVLAGDYQTLAYSLYPGDFNNRE